MTKLFVFCCLFAFVALIMAQPSVEGQNRTKSVRSFGNTIKGCIQSCRRLLFRGDRDLNYCIEGCRIRIYRKIYDCVYDQCNDKGTGIPAKFSREQYHQCVYLCKVKPKIKPRPSLATTSTISSTSTSSTAAPMGDSTMGESSVTPFYSKNHFIPLEYHYFSDRKKSVAKKAIAKQNSLNN